MRLYEHLAYDTETPVDSFWQATAPEIDVYPALQQDRTADVAIIGAGYTGLNAALTLAKTHGLDAVVVDAAQPGWGASGRNGGFACTGGVKLSDRQIVKQFGAEAAADFRRAQCQAVDFVKETIETNNISADVTPPGDLQLAHSARGFSAMKSDAEFQRQQFGEVAEILDNATLAERGYSIAGIAGGALTPHGFGIHPLRYTAGLAKAATTAGATIYGQSPVTAIEQDAGGAHHLRTPQGTLRAKSLIVATNGYGDDALPSALGGRIMPVMSAIMVTRPLSDEEIIAQGWSNTTMTYDTLDLLHYFRLLPDHRMLFGMRGALKATPRAIAAAQQRLRDDFERFFPHWAQVEPAYFWSGLICMSRNMRMYVGPIPGLANAWTSLAYHGNGVSMATWGGRAVADLAAGADWSDRVPAVMRGPLPRFPFPAFRRRYLQMAYLGYRMSDRWS